MAGIWKKRGLKGLGKGRLLKALWNEAENDRKRLNTFFKG